MFLHKTVVFLQAFCITELRKTRTGFYKTCGERLKDKSILGGFGICFSENI